MPGWILETTKDLAPFGAALLAYLLGLRAFHRQKEFNLVRERYLEKCLDQVIDNAEILKAIFWNNWSNALQIIKLFRDTDPKDFDTNVLTQGFKEVPTNFAGDAHNKLRHLVKDDIFWLVQQKLSSFVHRKSMMITNDLCVAINLYLNNQAMEDTSGQLKQEICAFYLQHLKDMGDDAHPYEVYSNELQNISFVIEREKMTFKTLN